ncbi:MAG TPA: SRPBCC family protein [Thermomicrobiales bacterium]|nr:SRPBCC family protein [Thermomicrobiales bacterium]
MNTTSNNQLHLIAEPNSHAIVGIREFDAPPALVFRAFTEPELLKQWLGPRRLETKVETFEVRDGGRWRFLHIDTDGTEYAFRGVFHGTPSVEGIIQTFEFEGAPGEVLLERMTFEDLGGRTRIHGDSISLTVAGRDAMIESGMESGMIEGYEKLDELLARLINE